MRERKNSPPPQGKRAQALSPELSLRAPIDELRTYNAFVNLFNNHTNKTERILEEEIVELTGIIP
jgi:hypothetical protein